MAVSKLMQRCHLLAAYLLLVIIFIWSSSSKTNTILSGSVIKNRLNTTTPVPSTNKTNLNLNFTNKPPVSTPDSSPSSLVNVSLESPFFDPPESEIYQKNGALEGQMAVLRSYIAKTRPSGCEGRGIYVYDLPMKFNKDLIDRCAEIGPGLDYCKILSNNGMGEPLSELGEGWYNTDQFTLEPIFYSRIVNHPCRVQDMEDAKLFYVPYYAGYDVIQWYLSTNVSNDVRDKLSNEIVEWLELQKPWKRNSGLDHFFVLGLISWEFRRSVNGSFGSRFSELDELQNPFKLIIEREPWHITDVGVPYPTHFHPRSDEDIMAWQAKLKGMHRKNLMSFAGAPRNDSKSIRSILIEQCTAVTDKYCKFFSCRNNACLSPVPLIKLFTESEFCFQPRGDSPTRKSMFDSLIAGCIPVIFDPLTAYYQYPWHLPEDHTKYSIYIDQNSVMSEVNVVEILTKIPSKRRKEMRRYIIEELMPRLVYSDPKAKLEKFEDAVSIAVNSLLESVVSRLPAL